MFHRPCCSNAVRSSCQDHNENCRMILMEKQLEQKQKWIDDLQSGMYINCVYCGHRYGPEENTPVSKAEQLRRHVAVCPEHPMSKLLQIVRLLDSKLPRQKTVQDLESDAGPGHRKYEAIFTDAEIYHLRDILKSFE